MFFLMELCETSLFIELHVNRKNFTSLESLRYAIETANAMYYLHNRTLAIIHRDLKSHNLLIGPDGSIKLCDFGLANTTNKGIGTPSYMAPELLLCQSFNKSVDVYAFGIFLWELFAQDMPFSGLDPQDIRDLVVKGHRPSLSCCNILNKLGSFIAQCWDQVPSRRPDFGKCLTVLNMTMEEISHISHLDALNFDMGDSLDVLLK